MRRPQQRRRHIPQRRRIFLGCEGESERGYGARLVKLVEDRHSRIYVDLQILQPGGGDPLALVQLAVRRMLRQTERRGAYVAQAVLLDNDKLEQSPPRDQQAISLADQNGFIADFGG